MKLEDGYKIKAGDRLLIEVVAKECKPEIGSKGWVEDGCERVSIDASTFLDEVGIWPLKFDQLWINRSQIKEVIPHEFQVGDRVKIGESTGVILAIHNNYAWVVRDGGQWTWIVFIGDLTHEG